MFLCCIWRYVFHRNLCSPWTSLFCSSLCAIWTFLLFHSSIVSAASGLFCSTAAYAALGHVTRFCPLAAYAAPGRWTCHFLSSLCCPLTCMIWAYNWAQVCSPWTCLFSSSLLMLQEVPGRAAACAAPWKCLSLAACAALRHICLQEPVLHLESFMMDFQAPGEAFRFQARVPINMIFS